MRTLCLTVLLTAVAAANPVVLTFINEAGLDGTMHCPWVELAIQPGRRSEPCYGWRLQTSTSECTLDVVLAPGECVVVDSDSLAEGRLGHGKLKPDPERDSIRVTTDSTTQSV